MKENVYFIKESELGALSSLKSEQNRDVVAASIKLRGDVFGEWDSTHILGIVDKRHEVLKRYGWDKRSFAAGWSEGRINMLGELYSIIRGDKNDR